VFRHERSVADVAFDPKGRRLATATYGGAMLWYARIAEQKPQALKWAGAHIAILWSPDGRFLISSMQENALHGWRVADGKDMRMGGYPAKVKSLAFLHGGAPIRIIGGRSQRRSRLDRRIDRAGPDVDQRRDGRAHQRPRHLARRKEPGLGR
jgi:WD40 repeat protein